MKQEGSVREIQPALKMEAPTPAKYYGQPLEAEKDKEMYSPLEPSKRSIVLWHLDFSPVILVEYFPTPEL